jgi:SPP1 gp7 family putative phage head morphogenesis protein
MKVMVQMAQQQTYDNIYDWLEKQNDYKQNITEKEVLRVYALILRDVRAHLGKLFEQLGVDNLSWEEMNRYNRMKALETQIIDTITTYGKETDKSVYAMLSNVYVDSFLYTGFVLETTAQAKLAYAMIDKAVIDAIIQAPFTGLTLGERLEKNRSDVIVKLKTQLAQGIAQGESYTKMAKRIKDVLDGDAQKAIRVVRTEAGRVQNEARFNSMLHAQKKGISIKKMWVTSLDKKARHSHRILDGQIRDLDKPFEYNGYKAMAPQHFGVAGLDINCRCKVVERVEGFDYANETRRVWNAEERKSELIPYTTYQEWYKERVLKK